MSQAIRRQECMYLLPQVQGSKLVSIDSSLQSSDITMLCSCVFLNSAVSDSTV